MTNVHELSPMRRDALRRTVGDAQRRVSRKQKVQARVRQVAQSQVSRETNGLRGSVFSKAAEELELLASHAATDATPIVTELQAVVERHQYRNLPTSVVLRALRETLVEEHHHDGDEDESTWRGELSCMREKHKREAEIHLRIVVLCDVLREDHGLTYCGAA